MTKTLVLCKHLGQAPLFDILKVFPLISKPLTRLSTSGLKSKVMQRVMITLRKKTLGLRKGN